MKKLIFIDNNRGENALEWFYIAKKNLKLFANIPDAVAESAEFIQDFSTGLTDLEREAILFNNQHIILTASLLQSDPVYNAFGQLFDYLTAAGQHNIKDVIFIDAINKLPRAINRILDGYNRVKEYKHILKAINNNILVTIDSENDGVLRLTIKRGKLVQSPYDLLNLLN